eukprot:scaffold85861_cov59-Phaeocystis_antarctica.AAC.1
MMIRPCKTRDSTRSALQTAVRNRRSGLALHPTEGKSSRAASRLKCKAPIELNPRRQSQVVLGVLSCAARRASLVSSSPPIARRRPLVVPLLARLTRRCTVAVGSPRRQRRPSRRRQAWSSCCLPPPLPRLTSILSARQPTARRPRSKLRSKLVTISRRLNQRQRIRRPTVTLALAISAIVAVATVVASIAAARHRHVVAPLLATVVVVAAVVVATAVARVAAARHCLSSVSHLVTRRPHSVVAARCPQVYCYSTTSSSPSPLPTSLSPSPRRRFRAPAAPPRPPAASASPAPPASVPSSVGSSAAATSALSRRPCRRLRITSRRTRASPSISAAKKEAAATPYLSYLLGG